MTDMLLIITAVILFSLFYWWAGQIVIYNLLKLKGYTDEEIENIRKSRRKQ